MSFVVIGTKNLIPFHEPFRHSCIKTIVYLYNYKYKIQTLVYLTKHFSQCSSITSSTERNTDESPPAPVFCNSQQ